MTPERWQQICDLLEKALELAPEQQSAFLNRACSSDHSLRQEVETLLASGEDVRTSFLKTLPLQGNEEARLSFLLSPPKVRAVLTKGTRLGEYEIASMLGAGGMGEVYRAKDRRLERDVAIKVLPPHFSSDADRLRRFEQEARAAAPLNHPNILAVYQMGTHEGVPYLVSELLEGETLREKLQRGRIAVSNAIDDAVQIARGLAAAHEKGIVHRDLKPENLFVTKDNRIKILDFGLAKLTQARGSSVNSAVTAGNETEPGLVMGTAGYMSPEQVRGKGIDHRTDIFAFGAILYEMLTAQRAFQKLTSAETMAAILNEEPTPISQIGLQIPPGLQRVVRRCLEKNPEQRFQSASDLGFALEALSDSGALGATSVHDGRKKLNWETLTFAGLAVAAVAVLSGGLYLYLHPKPKFTEKDTIVLAAFDNKTGEAVFDDPLNQALAIQLEQSPFLKILSDLKVGETLKLMGRTPGEHISADIAREICVRSGSKAILQGSISRLGNEYLLGLRVTACLTGDKLAESQGEASSKEGVLKTLSNMASDTRARLGESLASVHRFDYQIPTTTTSLEALKAYSIGRATLDEHGADAAIPFFKRAIELDPNFAKAYVYLAKMYSNQGEFDLAAENATKAYNLREHVSEEEQYDITSQYHQLVTGDLYQAREAYDAWIRAYPRTAIPLHNRANIFKELGQHEQALEGYRAAIRLEPYFAYGYTDAGFMNIALNRLDDAKSVLDGLKQNGLNPEIAWDDFYAIAFLRNDAEEMTRQLEIGISHPDTKSDALRLEARTHAYHGRLAKARELVFRATQLQNEPGLRDVAAEGEADLALEDAVCGAQSAAKSDAISALSHGRSRTARAKAAVALAEAGELVRARALVAELEKTYPLDTMLNRYWVPTIRASIQIRQGNPRLADSTLQSTLDLELSTLDLELGGRSGLFPAYVRGQAHLAAQNPAAAIAEFQKLLDHPGIVLMNPAGAVARLQIGRAYSMSGSRAKAKEAYDEFFALWKDADPDIPILKQAKAEYARLR